MNIVVTGGSSTVGKHLKQLLPQAHYITSSDCDLTDYRATLSLFNSLRPDVVIHLAALVGGIQDNIQRPVDYLEQNLLINTNTIKASYECGTRKLIALSSTCAYPDKVSTYPMTEEAMFEGPPTPTNFGYAYSKRCMIAQIEAYNAQHNTEYCYIIPSNLYSELDVHVKEKAHYVTALLDKILEQESNNSTNLMLLGTGRPLRQFTYAGDIAEILTLMIKKNLYKSFNVSNEETYTIHQLAEITLRSLDKAHWTISYTDPNLDGQYRKDVSIAKMRQFISDFNFTKFAKGIKKVYIEKKKLYYEQQ